ncbi:MAG: hypothetical protein COW32_00065 [Candidatus Aquicultor secundus]|uniref:Uncharacterized protein n=1 Tax=Candidatus Aquicultor secundus TaxID=1973895 RepID=A0A2M7T870_9ACTN|nr:DUF1122 domain-containing protein [Solirubrobacter sp.]PIU26732.1 MAG: hypothetical protein COT10_07080 [Candidatus Aquicultor secundus]PIW23280.1 MAG: hypothetical protein COW32_00065 [Candidatus Aquicultor secundus]PIX52475.1 MAG: hypothetical protein COZ51_03895 [Candidatus Aquicultor secundus]PIY38496.1 MAG: hypothetical protein COZ03_08035 [Candidatus Aquicultor secundus]
MLWKTGFTFKNRYFAEGWMEGNTKLQEEKPLNREIRRRQIKKLAQEPRKSAMSYSMTKNRRNR